MVSEILNVQTPSDRRQIAVPVENDRRSGIDRRAVLRDKKENESGLVYALEVLPPVRRVASVPHKVSEGEIVPALGMASLALINLPEDFRDIRGAINQIKGAPPLYDYKNYQHNFSFFKGTAIEKWLHKHVDAEKKWAKWLYDNDKSLDKTSFGEKIIQKLKVDEADIITTNITNIRGKNVKAISYTGSSFGKITARALRRTTSLGLIAMGLIEIPRIIKATKQGNGVIEKTSSTAKQTAKSAINVATITAGISYCGAIGSKYGKGFGSLIGMGVGAIIGSKISERVQKVIS